MDSNLFVISVSLPVGTASGTPKALHFTQTNTPVSMGLAHCPTGACGNCGIAATSDQRTNALVSIQLVLVMLVLLF